MPNLFLIDGVPGGGKSELMEYCKNIVRDCTFIVKYTNKGKEIDGIVRNDLNYQIPNDFETHSDEYFYYSYPNHSSTFYCVKKSELTDTLKEVKNVFLIVRSKELICEIKNYYSKYININVITIFLYCDRQILLERTKKQLIERNRIDKLEELLDNRLKRNDECLKSYISSLSEKDKIYDYVILNDVSKDEFFSLIRNIIRNYQDFDNKFLKPTAFIIMPMPNNRDAAHFLNVKNAIRCGAENVGFCAVRHDDKYLETEVITKSIQNAIEEYTVCIADLTDSRPNCYFELGFAFGKNGAYGIRNTLILTENRNDLHFDVKDLESHEYSYRLNDYSEITKIVSKWLIEFTEKHILMTNELSKVLKLH